MTGPATRGLLLFVEGKTKGCQNMVNTRVENTRVMVVEDNELNLRLFCDLLAAHGYLVDALRDGRDVLARARSESPQIIVMDIQLPHVSGLELIAAIKGDATLAHIPILAVTAYAGREDEQRIRAAGAESYIAKPVSVIRFLEAVSALLPDQANVAVASAQPVIAQAVPVTPSMSAATISENTIRD